MFNWFWEFLYGLSKALFQLIDAMVFGAKKLCGLDPIWVNGEETDLLTFLFRSDEVGRAFRVAALSGIVVVILFAVFAIIRSLTSRKNEMSPLSVLVRTGKTLLIFLCVPAVIISCIWIFNEFIEVLYRAIGGGEGTTIGGFLFTTCAEGAWWGDPSDAFLTGAANYTDIGEVESYISISYFNFMLSYLAGIAILFPIANMLIMFVDRAISIVLLFIVSPYSIATNVLDDGAHFKLWRDQILTKFVTGYGCILGLSVYALLMKLVIGDGVVFFTDSMPQVLPIISNSFLNSLMKIVIILGGAFSLQRIMAVIGNLVTAGGGSNELRDMAITGAQMGRFLGGAARFGMGVVTAPHSLYNFGSDSAHNGFFNTVAGRLGFRTSLDYKNNHQSASAAGASVTDNGETNDQHNSATPDYKPGSEPGGNSTIENIIGGGSGNAGETSTPDSGKKDRVSDTIMNGKHSLIDQTIGSINDPDEEEDR
ncbi:MAG: hypothetical protein MJ082_00795 [Clostridia bacterium]|nr:hypothetical protein [Clostridia bacterium]